MPKVFALAALCLLLALPGAAEDRYLFRQPSLSASEIAFSYAGDIWIVSRSGGDARRLTAHPGNETHPVFSPDGTQIAFSGEYDGSKAIYLIPSGGGVPKRLTWNHAQENEPVGWTSDGKNILFTGSGNTATDGVRLYTVDLEAGFPVPLPLPDAQQGSYSPDGTHLAYVPLMQFEPAWKRYRGGQMAKIWIANLADSSILKLPRGNSNDSNPLWIGNRIYFLSDRKGPVTLFSYDTKTHAVTQAIENRGFDLKSAAAGPGAIVYEQFGGIFLYATGSGEKHEVAIRVAGDFPQVRPRRVDAYAKGRFPALSPNGVRAVFETRGDIITLPVEKGPVRNLTNTPGVREREPVWSPKGDRIAYFSDESGEYQLNVRDQNGEGEVKKFSLGGSTAYYTNPRWSPDAEKILYLDNHLRLWYLDLASGKSVLVATDYSIAMANGLEGLRDLTPVWSPDSKWIAYSKQLPNHFRAIWIYSLRQAASTQVTDGLSDAKNPVFDRNGKYLYFTAGTDSGPALEVDLQSFSRSTESRVYLVVLSNADPSPLAPQSDEETAGHGAPKIDQARAELRIDFDGIGQRILALPMLPRSYTGLQSGKNGILFALAKAGHLPEAVIRYDLNERKGGQFTDETGDFIVSSSGEKVLYRKGGNWVVSSADDSGKDQRTLASDGLTIPVDPVAEWAQIYREAWRIVREFFYDPGYHGLDLRAGEARFAPFLKHLSSREDLNYLLEEALGELTVGHLWVKGGDVPEPQGIATGLLGADYTIDHGRYRFARVLNGENWNPETRAPLTGPAVNVKPGEYLLAVNGVELAASQNLYRVFEGLADRQVTLKVGPDPDQMNLAREVVVAPVSEEQTLRYLGWIEDNRRKVDELSNGRVAYLHLPDTGAASYKVFSRFFYAQVGKQALIVDDRFNHGGHFATDIVDYMKRTVTSVLSGRDGADFPIPPGIYGPKVMLTNEYSASGGDALPWYFKQQNAGKVVGATTWGGMIGLGWSPDLMDGGVLTVPCCAIWDPAGIYQVENHGVSPDVEVEADPKQVREGHDPQLE